MKNTLRTVFVALFAACAVGSALSEPVAQPSPQPALVNGTVHSVTLPNYNPDMPDGENRKLFSNSCTMCHSARYVLMQFELPRSKWSAEVNKMRTAFGCPLEPASVDKLVDYLMVVRGTK